VRDAIQETRFPVWSRSSSASLLSDLLHSLRTFKAPNPLFWQTLQAAIPDPAGRNACNHDGDRLDLLKTNALSVHAVLTRTFEFFRFTSFETSRIDIYLRIGVYWSQNEIERKSKRK
jgi:hypothetical protein